ncbi:DUF742 domain-containing protein [Amycolatopsis ultiminotia]|uniref:DUF742 domain-containing protein n=1 Tax=Amycolatopsis ultiminotia TaxID=543629 RepID=A0ABP6YMA3_9PSEU
MSDDNWYDEAAGPLVRPYTITSGRTPSDHSRLDLSTQVMTLQADSDPRGLGPEHQEIIELCRRPLSVAEIAAYVKLPLGVVRVLCGDLIDRGLVITRAPSQQPAQAPDHHTLQAVLDGLIKL